MRIDYVRILICKCCGHAIPAGVGEPEKCALCGKHCFRLKYVCDELDERKNKWH